MQSLGEVLVRDGSFLMQFTDVLVCKVDAVWFFDFIVQLFWVAFIIGYMVYGMIVFFLLYSRVVRSRQIFDIGIKGDINVRVFVLMQK